ncbi:MAG: phosphatidylserine decarboxylase family protein [bacterium]|nr:phosphatidylserine decarboxylase family protein [bacterium]
MPMTFAKEAWPFVLPFVVLSAGLFFFRQPVWGVTAVLLGLGVLLFFRDPQRRFDGPPEVVLAAADGLVTRVDTVEDAAIGPGKFRRVVTFLSVFDVHVQRTPTTGEVLSSGLTPGRKVAAFRADAGEVNENHLTVIRRGNGDLVGIRQIAGLLARRVVCYLDEGGAAERGELLGIIKFGSRVDLMVPEHYEVLVEKGDRPRTGATPVARPGVTPVAGPGPGTSSDEGP